MFAALPSAATSVRITHTPARYRKPGFEGGGWDGPSVSVRFRSSTPPRQVYRFYDRRARAAGWRATASGALGLTDRWTKTYPDGAAAYLSFALLTPTAASERLYYLAGGVAPVLP